ncbi:MAG: hypothetical protein ACK5Z2_06910 [Bacteroidota bacterium]
MNYSLIILFVSLFTSIILIGQEHNNDQNQHITRKSTTIIIQPNHYSPLRVNSISGSYKPTSFSVISGQIGIARNYDFRDKFRLSIELSTGSAPIKTGFFIEAGKVEAIDYIELAHRRSIYFLRYTQLSVIGSYKIHQFSKSSLFISAGFAYRRNIDFIATSSSSYSRSFTGPDVRIYQITLYNNSSDLNLWALPIGIYLERKIANRIYCSAGLRATIHTPNKIYGYYEFFPGRPEESNGTVSMKNYYVGLDLGFSFRKKTLEEKSAVKK